MIDKTGKVLLALIALGLWAHVAILVFQPISAVAQSDDLISIRNNTSMLARIATGRCPNPKICSP